MAETASVDAPVSDKPPTTAWMVGGTTIRHYDSQGNVSWGLTVRVIETYVGGIRENVITLTSAVAMPLVKLLNTKNFSGANPSMEKTIMQWLVSNGYYPASTYTGTPDV